MPSVRTASQDISQSFCLGRQMAPACFTAERSSRFVPRDSHPDKIVIVAPWTPREAVPRRFLDDELDGLESAVPGFVVEVAHADEPLAVARKQPLRSRHSRAQRQSGFHPRSLSALNARAGEPCT